MVLPVPEEPPELKEFVCEVRDRLGPSTYADWDALAVWAGNKVPSYLWSRWKPILENEGFTWQRFLKLMKYKTYDAIRWMNGEISWAEYVREIIDMLKGPIADLIRRR